MEDHAPRTAETQASWEAQNGQARILLAGNAEAGEEEYMASCPYARP